MGVLCRSRGICYVVRCADSTENAHHGNTRTFQEVLRRLDSQMKPQSIVQARLRGAGMTSECRFKAVMSLS